MLTRKQAHELVDDCGADLQAHYALASHWIGNDETIRASDDPAAFLHDYVDECADNGADADAVRERGPRCYEADSDDTGLDDPAEPGQAPDYRTENLQTALSGALEHWCAREGLPLSCADELRTVATTLSGNQRTWLNAYCALWEASGI